MSEISVTRDKVLINGYKHIDLPIGTIIMNAGNNGITSFGSAFKLCDGSSLSTTAYNELFLIINYKYGGSGGSFNLPNFLDRFPMGLVSVGASTLPTDSYPTSSTRQGGNSVIQSSQFTHGHSRVNPTVTGVNGMDIRSDCEFNNTPREGTLTIQTNYSNTTISDPYTQPHIPLYYTLNYFIYTGKDVIG